MAAFKHTEDITKGKFYLYRHIRLDKNEPFYIGIGTKCGNKSFDKIYKRAFSEKSRNIHWSSVVKNTPYDVDILFVSDDELFIKKKEEEFIKLYGRSDLNKGPLVNMTDGGELNLNPADEVWEKRKNTIMQNGYYDRMVERMKGFKVTKENNSVKKKIFVYDLSGTFIKEFPSIVECAKGIKVAKSTIWEYLDSNRNIYKYIIKSYFSGLLIDINSFSINENRKMGNQNNLKRKINGSHKVPIRVMDTKAGVAYDFKSIQDAEKAIGLNPDNRCLNRAMKKGKYKQYLIEKICL